MPCHHTFRARHFVAMSSVIATQCDARDRHRLAARTRRDPVVCVGYLGDGARRSTTSTARSTSPASFARRSSLLPEQPVGDLGPGQPQDRREDARGQALAYGMPGVRVDGNDVVAVTSR